MTVVVACPKCQSTAFQVGSPCPLCGYVGPRGVPVVAARVADTKQRIQEGFARARAQGKRIGRPPTPFDRNKAVALRKQGLSVKAVAKKLQVSRQKVERELAKAAGDGKPAKPARTLTGVDLRALKVKVQQEITALQQKLEAIEAVERFL